MMKKCLLVFVLILSQSALADMMVRTSPLTLLIGAPNVELGFKVTDGLSVGGGFTTWAVDINDIEMDFLAYHARADYYFSGAYNQGWYISGIFGAASIDLATTDDAGTKYKGDVNGTYVAFFGGYHWQWTQFFIDLGIGTSTYSFSDTLDLEDENGNKEEESIPAISATGLEFNIGWTF